VTWLRSVAPGATSFERVFGLRPNAYARFTELLDGLAGGGIDTTTLDACAQRIDALLRFEPDPTTALPLTEAQRAAVGFAEQYALDPHGLRDHHPRPWEAFNAYYGTLWSDGVVDDPTKEVGRLRNARVDEKLRTDLLREFSDAEIVELTATIATAIAFSKASVAFGAPEEMPLVVVPTPQIDGDVVR
jgi:hypothetical protein